MAANELMKEKECKDLWEMCVEHPFIKQMVKNELEHDKFRDYIIQDKLFCETFRGFVCSVLADCTDAVDFEAVHKLVADLQGYGHEAQMFKEIFDGLKISHADMWPHPTTEAFCNFLWRVSTTGTLADKLVVLYAIESSYMEWAERSIKANQKPSDPMYSKWVEIHSAKNLSKLVDWCKSRLTDLVGSSGEGLTHHHHHLFRRTLQHEIMFWDTAHRPGSSVFPGEFGVGHHARASGK